MPRGPREKSETGIYHIIMNGANKQEIFHDEEDSLKYLETIRKYKVQAEMEVYAWCLMNNHVHLLLKEGNEVISATMKRVGVSYASYYHQKYNTSGHLFQDRFKSENVDCNRYLLTVIRYIHQNPVKAGMVYHADEWRWSSCLGYYGKDPFALNLLDKDNLLQKVAVDYIITNDRFREFNERSNNDECLDVKRKERLTDDEAREVIKQLISPIEIAQVKSLPKEKRNAVLRKAKAIKGVSQRQVARILGVSVNLVFKAKERGENP